MFEGLVAICGLVNPLASLLPIARVLIVFLSARINISISIQYYDHDNEYDDYDDSGEIMTMADNVNNRTITIVATRRILLVFGSNYS